ncbi:hypothetical protein [Nostoc sp. TCL240-02]|uniref:hypothetical protein n=1 Tax=Nostoc sp. TCL240-02 TaxID=2572090 RepID=UPI00157F804A|nr:hypothetical protein [Nostoc sp. TCL240-02]
MSAEVLSLKGKLLGGVYGLVVHFFQGDRPGLIGSYLQSAYDQTNPLHSGSELAIDNQ